MLTRIDWPALLRSRTVHGLAVSAVSAAAGRLAPGTIDEAAIVDLVSVAFQFIGLVWAFFGRVQASGPLLKDAA